MRKKIFFSVIFLILFSLGFWAINVNAAAFVYPYPPSGDQLIDRSFSININVRPDSSNVCVVKGSINFSNLSCNNITVASGLLTAVQPSCQNTNFVIGIPKCSGQAKTLFVVSVTPEGEGPARINFSGVKINGSGVVLSTNFTNGNYDIITEELLNQAEEEPSPDGFIEPETPEDIDLQSQNNAVAGLSQASLLSGILNNFKLDNLSYVTILWMIIVIIIIGIGWFIWRRKKKK